MRRTRTMAIGIVAVTVSALGLTAATPANAEAAVASTARSCRSTAKPTALVVRTDDGAVRGTADAGVRSWKGIPYAAPPVGDLRWEPPVAPSCWRDVRDASDFGPACPQLDGTTVVGEEDCLTVNVWRPAPTAARKAVPDSPKAVPDLPKAVPDLPKAVPDLPKAVMVFVHGGGHVQGSASKTVAGVQLYDGAALASKGDVVVVTLQYRLGALGWLADDELAGAGTPSSGNDGLLDQIAALRWVQDNISRFGGDPTRVMLFGESAGAVDTCLLVASPLAKGLFSQALIQSGACVTSDAATANASAASFATAAGCANQPDVVACLRALPLDTVIRTLPGGIDLASLGRPLYGPYVDGRVLPDAPLELIRDGKGNHVPVIVGSNADETASLLRTLPTTDTYAAAVTGMVGPNLAPEVLAAYPVDQYASAGDAFIAATTDPRFTCTARATVDALLEGQPQPVYRYFFTHTMDGGALRARGAFHGLEVFFVFAKVGAAGYQPSPGELALSDAMIGYWSRFATTGDPNGGGAPAWPKANASTDPYLGLDSAITPGDGVRTAQCDFWAGLAR